MTLLAKIAIPASMAAVLMMSATPSFAQAQKFIGGAFGNFYYSDGSQARNSRTIAGATRALAPPAKPTVARRLGRPVEALFRRQFRERANLRLITLTPMFAYPAVLSALALPAALLVRIWLSADAPRS